MNYNNLIFFKESEFAQWFKQTYYLFGIKEIIKINALFPDVVAIMLDGSKKFIELEYHASNFRNHGHYAPHCDLVISYLKNYNHDFICGVPIIALFDCNGNGGKISNIQPSNFLFNLQTTIFNNLPKRNITILEELEEAKLIKKQIQKEKRLIKKKIKVLEKRSEELTVQINSLILEYKKYVKIHATSENIHFAENTLDKIFELALQDTLLKNNYENFNSQILNILFSAINKNKNLAGV